jgi:hypothetical protein
MSLKTAALSGLIGTLLIAIMTLFGFVNTVVAAVSGLVPAVSVITALLQLVASVCVTIFFYVFHQKQA